MCQSKFITGAFKARRYLKCPYHQTQHRKENYFNCLKKYYENMKEEEIKTPVGDLRSVMKRKISEYKDEIGLSGVSSSLQYSI